MFPFQQQPGLKDYVEGMKAFDEYMKSKTEKKDDKPKGGPLIKWEPLDYFMFFAVIQTIGAIGWLAVIEHYK